MPDFMERMACLRAAIKGTREGQAGLHQDCKLAVQLREHLAGLLEIERRLLAAGEVFSGVVPNAAPSLPKGWKITRKDSMFKPITITAPNGYSAYVTDTASNPENVLYLLAEALLTPGVKEAPDA